MKTPSDPNVTEQPKRVARGSLRRMVSCNMANHKCPPECKHLRPHAPIPDNYVGGAIDECHQVEGPCGYRADQPMCKCS